MLATGREMREEIVQQGPRWFASLRLLLVRALFDLSRDWHPAARTASYKSALSTSLGRIMPALDLLRRRGPAAVGAQEAAVACGLSRSAFGRLFRKTMGVSFASFRLRAHLSHAAHRLLTSEMSTEAIAVEVGFADASHLHRTFVKQYGCTPGKYRAMGRSQSDPAGDT